jgi:hypothetical protein
MILTPCPDRLPKFLPFQAKPSSRTMTRSSLPRHSRTNSAPGFKAIPSRVRASRRSKGAVGGPPSPSASSPSNLRTDLSRSPKAAICRRWARTFTSSCLGRCAGASPPRWLRHCRRRPSISRPSRPARTIAKEASAASRASGDATAGCFPSPDRRRFAGIGVTSPLSPSPCDGVGLASSPPPCGVLKPPLRSLEDRKADRPKRPPRRDRGPPNSLACAPR